MFPGYIADKVHQIKRSSQPPVAPLEVAQSWPWCSQVADQEVKNLFIPGSNTLKGYYLLGSCQHLYWKLDQFTQ